MDGINNPPNNDSNINDNRIVNAIRTWILSSQRKKHLLVIANFMVHAVAAAGPSWLTCATNA